MVQLFGLYASIVLGMLNRLQAGPLMRLPGSGGRTAAKQQDPHQVRGKTKTKTKTKLEVITTCVTLGGGPALLALRLCYVRRRACPAGLMHVSR
mgnify:CR=1 FL=1